MHQLLSQIFPFYRITDYHVFNWGKGRSAFHALGKWNSINWNYVYRKHDLYLQFKLITLIIISKSVCRKVIILLRMTKRHMVSLVMTTTVTGEDNSCWERLLSVSCGREVGVMILVRSVHTLMARLTWCLYLNMSCVGRLWMGSVLSRLQRWV